MNGVKINSLEVENVKRVKAVALEPAENGLTVIGGRNGQGKTSVLDAIAWALGGERMRPTNARRDGAAGDARLKVVLDNGIVVERKGKNGSLKVTDPAGKKGGQALLDSFVEQLALDLPRFMNGSDKDKAATLLKVIGVGDELAALEAEEDRLANQRLTIGRMAKQKRGAADDMPFHANAPTGPVSAAELIKEQQEILARNGENQRKRMRVEELRQAAKAANSAVEAAGRRVQQAEAELATARADLEREVRGYNEAVEELGTASKTADELVDESTAEIEASIAAIEETNAMVRDNQMRAAAEAEADELESQYADMNDQIDGVRARKRALLDGAELPLPDLSVERGSLVYKGQPWDCMSGSEQLRVATAIVRALKPECGFVLLDKTEQMDVQTLAEFGRWAASEGLQVICTRVSTGDECSIVIEDGYMAGSAAYRGEDAEGGAEEEADGAANPVFNFPGKDS